MASSGMAASAGAEAEAEREDVEFGDSVFDFVNEDGPSPEAEVEGEAGAGGEVEIESSSDFIAESEPALGEPEPAVAEFDLGDFSDLDQGLEEPSRPARQPVDDASTEMGSGLGAQDLDFNRMEPIPGEDSIGLEGLDSAMSELEASEDLSLGEASTSPEVTPVEPTADMSAGIADDDEVATKLDLARAYLDMGDEEGARSILDEVLAEGSEAQQSEARGLMQRIA